MKGSHATSKKLSQARKPAIVIGADILSRPDGAAILSSLQSYANTLQKDKNWKVFNVLQTNASQTGAMDIGYTPGVDEILKSKPSVLFLLGADAGVLTKENIPKGCFVIYQGHHGDAGAELADVVLPGAAYTEKQATYVNTEGRAQQTLMAVNPPGLAREDWKILRAISAIAGEPLPYDTLDQVRDRMEQIAPHLTRYGHLEENNFIKQIDQLGKVKFHQSILKFVY